MARSPASRGFFRSPCRLRLSSPARHLHSPDSNGSNGEMSLAFCFAILNDPFQRGAQGCAVVDLAIVFFGFLGGLVRHSAFWWPGCISIDYLSPGER